MLKVKGFVLKEFQKKKKIILTGKVFIHSNIYMFMLYSEIFTRIYETDQNESLTRKFKINT